jgi:hypothetical protein
VGRQRSAGLVSGSAVAITFGTVFVLVNSGGLTAPWPLVIRVTGLLVAVLLSAGLVLTVRRTSPGRGDSATGYVDRRYWLIVALEAVALFGGLAVVNGVLHRPEISVAWVALVVGVHFFGLGRIWHLPAYHRLGAVMTVLGIAGFLVHALGGPAAAVGLVAGVGSGATLYAFVAIALNDALTTRRARSSALGVSREANR